MKRWEEFCGVDGWNSKFVSVQRLLNHLARQSKSESSRAAYLYNVYRFCTHLGVKSPGELVALSKEKIERALADYLDGLLRRDLSKLMVRTVKGCLVTFFKSNGFKNEKELELPNYPVPARYRKRPEYPPTKDEVLHMANASGSVMNRAIILFLYSTGLRNSTLRALCYGDVKEGLERGEKNLLININPEMKKRIPSACKGNIPYHVFTSEEATEALKLYLVWRSEKHGPPRDDEPLFIST
ncbi:MAG: tyrosine-type recombinase/integrase [Nitrososphaerales archaeon]